MGQRGIAPQPLELKILKGRAAPSRLTANPGVVPPPAKPADLSPAASAVWDRILEATAATSHIGQAHADTLRLFCETTATEQAMNPKGSREWQNVVLVSLRLARELCLTPATSAGLVRARTPDRAIDKYLAKPG